MKKEKTFPIFIFMEISLISGQVACAAAWRTFFLTSNHFQVLVYKYDLSV